MEEMGSFERIIRCGSRRFGVGGMGGLERVRNMQE